MVTIDSKNLKMHFGDYDIIRPFLRFISYGCYHKQQFTRLFARSGRSYDDNLSRARHCLPEQKLKEFRQRKKLLHTIKGDTYYDADNYLFHSYRMCIASPQTLFDMLTTFQVLGDNLPHSVIDIGNKGWTPKLPAGYQSYYQADNKLSDTVTLIDNAIDWDTSRPAYLDLLKDLTALGYIIKLPAKKGRPDKYKLQPNPLTGLSHKEAAELCLALDFYKNIALVSVPGYFIADSLRQWFNLPPKPPISQLKGCHFAKILDDHILDKLLYALRNKLAISFYYGYSEPENTTGTHKKNHIPGKLYTALLPQSLKFIYDHNIHQYLNTTSAKGQRNRFRLDNIHNLTFSQIAISPPAAKPKSANSKELRLRIHHTGASSVSRLKNSLAAAFPGCIFSDEENDSFLCSFAYGDLLSCVPQIRTFFPFAEVLPSDKHNLRKRLQDDLKEALKNYGELV